MELKRILARDSRTATEKAMALYGPDVLVIANHSIDGQTELIVAIDIAPEAPAALVREEPSARFQAMEPTRMAAPASGNMQAFEEAMALVRNTQAAVAEAPSRPAPSTARRVERSAAPAPTQAHGETPSERANPSASGRRTGRANKPTTTVFWGDLAIPTLADMGAPAQEKPPAPQRRRSAAAAGKAPVEAAPSTAQLAKALDEDWQVPGVGDITVAPRSTARRRNTATGHTKTAAAPVLNAPLTAEPLGAVPSSAKPVGAPAKRRPAAPAHAVVTTAAETTGRHPSASATVTVDAEAMASQPTPRRRRAAQAIPADPPNTDTTVAHSTTANTRTNASAPVRDPAPPAAQSTAQTPSADTAPAERGRELVDLVRAEIAALRQEFVTNLKLQQLQAGSAGHPVADPLMAALDQAGAPAALRALLLESAQTATDVADGARRVRDALAAGLQAEALALPLSGVHALCGPSGAGKSLMAARWLQQATQDHESDQLALISYCDQRPGAWSQTQMLAAQTGVPAYRANSPDALKTLLNELSDRVLVVIDTPGTEPLRHAQTLLEQWPQIGLHTVLPADASPATVRRFWQDARLPWQSLLISKIDESDQPWGLLQQLCNQRIPIAGLSDSPHAQAPLQRWRADTLLDRAMAPVEAVLPPPEALPPDAPALDGPALGGPALGGHKHAHAPTTSPPAHSAAPRDAAAQARAHAALRTPPPAIVLKLKEPERRRSDALGTAAPKHRPRPQWAAA